VPDNPSGLRERKKARVRTLIADTAMGLFAVRGFDEVTVAEVAQAAEVGITTVFNYFPTKEDLFYDRQNEVVEHLSRVVQARAPGQSFAAACRMDMLELIKARDWRAGLAPAMADFYRLVDRSPALQARARLMVDRSVAHLAATLADELSVETEDIVAVAAAGVLTSLRTGLLDQSRRDSLYGLPVETIASRLVEATNQTFDLLAGDLAALGGTMDGEGTSSRRAASGPSVRTAMADDGIVEASGAVRKRRRSRPKRV
jgi:AcrR family transcriptional regulator